MQWASGTLDEDTEHDVNRVFWQASQPQDPVLNKLMNDACMPREPPQIDHEKGWSPSPVSGPSDASSSSAATLTERTARVRRTQKHRPPIAAVVPQTAPNSTRPESNLDKSVNRLVAILPLVSKQADENAKREQEALQEKRRKRKRAARALAERSEITKKHRNSSDVKGKQRATDVTFGEEGMMAVDEAQVSRVMQRGGMAQHCEVVERRAPANRMPPLSFIPPRRSDVAESSTSSAHRNIISASKLQTLEGAEPPSFSSSSFVVASTPLAVDRVSNSANDLHTTTLVTGDRVTTSALKGISVPSSTSEPECLSKSTVQQSPTQHPEAQSMQTESSASARSYYTSHAIPTNDIVAPQPTPSQAPSFPKVNGPPPLGMRRLLNGQTPSSSQGLIKDRRLPLKQDKFKVPFARNEHQSRSTERLPQSAVRGAHQNSTGATLASLASTSNLSSREQLSKSAGRVQTAQAQPAQSLSRFSLTNNAVQNPNATVSEDDRSSSPPAEANSSIDFDMGIDADELERACSMYD